MAVREQQNEKERVALALLARSSLFVYLDPRREGVRVPASLGKQAQLVLQFGLNMPVPILDLAVDAEGIRGTLSFNRQPFTCHLPWPAVFALVDDDGMGMVFERDLPEEIAAEVEAGFRHEQAPRGPRLEALDGGRAEKRAKPEPEAADRPTPVAAARPARPALRLARRDETGPREAALDRDTDEASGERPPTEPPSAPSPPRGGHLRRIK